MPQVGIITPAQMGVLPSLEMVVWVAVGGRATLVGAIVGAVGVNLGRSILTNSFPSCGRFSSADCSWWWSCCFRTG